MNVFRRANAPCRSSAITMVYDPTDPMGKMSFNILAAFALGPGSIVDGMPYIVEMGHRYPRTARVAGVRARRTAVLSARTPGRSGDSGG